MHLRALWLAMQASQLTVVENTTLADVVAGRVSKEPPTPRPVRSTNHLEGRPGAAMA